VPPVEHLPARRCALGLRRARPVPSLYLPCTFPVPSLYLPCTFPVPSLYLPCTFPVPSLYLPCRSAACSPCS
jgi:hypothetical protein